MYPQTWHLRGQSQTLISVSAPTSAATCFCASAQAFACNFRAEFTLAQPLLPLLRLLGRPLDAPSYRRINGAIQARANITIELQQRKTTIRPVTHVQPAYVSAKVQCERAYRSLIAR